MRANQGVSKAKLRDGNAVCTLWVHPPSSPCLTLYAEEEPISKGHCRQHLCFTHTPTLALCTFPFQQHYTFYNMNTILLWLISTEDMSCWISEASSNFICVSLSHSLIYYLWQVEIPHRWEYGHGYRWVDQWACLPEQILSLSTTTVSGIIISWCIVTTSEFGELFSSSIREVWRWYI